MYKYMPQRKPRAALTITGLLFLCAVLLLFVSFQILAYKVFFQLAFVLCFTFGIQTAVRYALTDFCYCLDNLLYLDQNNSFRVVKIGGKRENLVCDIDFMYVCEVAPKAEFERLLQKYGKIENRCNFCTNLFSKEAYVMVYQTDNRYECVYFEADQAFLAEIKLRMENTPWEENSGKGI